MPISVQSANASSSLNSLGSLSRVIISNLDNDSNSSRASSVSAPVIRPSKPTFSSTTSSFQTTCQSRRVTRSSAIEGHVLGPEHLEHAYSMAYNELNYATIYALYRLGYKTPKHPSEEDDIFKPTLQMVLAAKFADVKKARKKVDEADRKLTEAIEKGQTWNNTPWPRTRLIFDETGMAIDEVEVDSDEEEEEDERERELKEIWARFASVSDTRQTCMQNRGSKKRKHPGDAVNQPRTPRRCRLGTQAKDSDTPLKRRAGLRSKVSQ